ncbi:hypothetical protein [Sphingomonas prati]|uniref:Uncharacterized protein n=2 Tax=Sphingomonas prati TaxID=1843237 RepID=A0A7W9BUB3_9SPHN|nr:hypothetical protein [Sphingomonas prati]MBB5730259.1 hypothetical protein [Sphingomonas prati]
MMTRTGRHRSGLMNRIGLAVAVAGLLLFAGLWMGARREAAALRDWQTAMLQRIAQAEAKPGASALLPNEAGEAFDRIVAARDGAIARTALASGASGPDPARPTPAANTEAEISRLRATQSTGTAAGDARIIERDSRAAWTGWK